MKFYIGKPVNWIGPYQIAGWLKYVGVSEDKCHELGERLNSTWVGPFLQKIHDKKKQKVKFRIDPHDVWSVYWTIAQVAHPLLVRLKETKQGAPHIDDEDVPEELKSTNAPPYEEWGTDENWFKRYDWILDEMIWAFEQIINDNTDQFYGNRNDIHFIDNPDGSCSIETGPDWNHDKEGHDAYNARIQRGTNLFGKYFQTLWD